MKSILLLSMTLLCLSTLPAQDCSQFTLDALSTNVSCFGGNDGSIDLITPCSSSSSGTSNLALNQPATQSSTQGDAVASRANDGNTSGAWWDTYSVSGTNWSSQPYWEVDLGNVFQIEEIEVWQRTDCCSSFLADYYVLVSDMPFSSASLSAVLNQAGVTSIFHSGEGGLPATETIETTGRYVRIQMQGAHLLQLAEVIVTGGEASSCDVTVSWDNGLGDVEDPSNLSSGTYQVTVTNTEGCSATGSYTITEPSALSASITENATSLDAAAIGGTPTYTYHWSTGATTPSINFSASDTYTVTITDNNNCTATASVTTDCVAGGSCDDGDACTTNDIFDANCDCVGTFQDSDNDGVCDADDLCPGFDDSIDTNNNGIPDDCDNANCNIFSISGTATHVTCGGANDGSIILDLPCTPGGGGGTNLALNKPSILSSTSGDAIASRANDGNTDGNWYASNSVAGSNWEYQPYWEVDLGTSQTISEVEVWGRTDCCSSFLSNYHVLVSENPFSSASLNDVLAQAGVTSAFHDGVGGTPITETIATSGRYVRVQLQGSHLLQLAEVVVKSGGDPTCDLTFDWDNDLGHIQNPNNLGAGTYSVTVTSGDGCVDMETFIIQEPTPITCNITETGGNVLQATATGGANPYTYLWNNGTSNRNFTYSTGGTYSVTITDANACTCTAEFTTDCVVGSTCNDGDDCTINDVYDSDCNCVGTFVDDDNDGVCNANDICPGFDDHIDANNNGIPDDCEGSGDLTIQCPSDIEVHASSPNGATVTWNLPNVTSTCNIGGGTCPSSVNGYTYLGEFEEHHYFVSNSANTWAWGKQSCIDAGGQMVKIETQAENLFLKDEIPTAVFIGLTDEAVEGTYKWIDGTPLGTYSNFGTYGSNTDARDYGILNTWLGGQWSHKEGTAYKKHLLEFSCENGPTLNQTAGLASGNTFSIGTHTISYQATDACGNTEVCSFTITVNAPNSNITLSCPNNITVAQSNPGGATVTWNNPTANTTCPEGLESLTQTSGNTNGQVFSVGTTIVSYEVVDECGSIANCSFTVTVEADTSGELPTGYCSSMGEQPWWQWIQVFNFGSINNPSNKSPYNDFTTQNTSVTMGGTYPITITPEFSWMAFDEYYSVWIDYNRDGDLEDAGELAFQASGMTEVSGSITIPATATEGVTLMRVAMKNGSYADPCESFPYGEVEDYSVTITSSPGLVPLMMAETGQVLHFEAQQGYQEAQLYWVNNTGADNDLFVIERSTNGVDFSPIAEMNAWAEESRTRYHNMKDQQPVTGNNFYRLALHYMNGEVLYSNVEMLHFSKQADFNVFPNPVTSNEVYLDLSAFENKAVDVQVYNQFGHLVQQTKIETANADPQVLDVTTLQNGLYMVFVKGAGRRSVGKKLVVTKMY